MDAVSMYLKWKVQPSRQKFPAQLEQQLASTSRRPLSYISTHNALGPHSLSQCILWLLNTTEVRHDVYLSRSRLLAADSRSVYQMRSISMVCKCWRRPDQVMTVFFSFLSQEVVSTMSAVPVSWRLWTACTPSLSIPFLRHLLTAIEPCCAVNTLCPFHSFSA